MEEAEGATAVQLLVAELREAHETREDADRRIAGLRKLIDGYLELFPLLDAYVNPEDMVNEDDPFDGPRPKGMDAARSVLKENPGKWYKVAAIVGMLDKRGWSPRSSNPRNAVRAALERLVEQGVISRGTASDDGSVVYGFPAPRKAPAPKAAPGDNYDDYGEEPF